MRHPSASVDLLPMFRVSAHIILFLVLLMTISSPVVLQAQAIDEVETELDEYFDSFNKTVYGLVRLLKRAEQPGVGQSDKEVKEQYRLLNADCPLYEEVDPIIPMVHIQLTVDVVFDLIDESGKYFLLKNDDIQFYIDRACTRRVFSAAPNPLNENQDVWQQAAQQLVEKHQTKYKKYERFINKLSKSADYNMFQTRLNEISSKHNIINRLYEKFSVGSSTEKISLANKFRLNGHILFGNSGFQTEFTDLSTGENNSGNTDLNIRSEYRFNQDARLRLHIKNRTETLLTPYKNWHAGGAYTHNFDGLLLDAGINIESYNDDLFDANDYNKTTFNTRLQKRNHDVFNYALRYQLQDQQFDIAAGNSYTRHFMTMNAQLKASESFTFLPELSYTLGNSENPLFEYNFVKPVVIFEFNRNSLRDRLRIDYENTSFSQIEIKDNSRYQFEWSRTNTRNGGVSNNNQIGVIYRNFPNTDVLNYVDVYARFNRRKGSGNRRMMFRFRQMPNAQDSDHFDIRLGSDRDGAFYVGYDVNWRSNIPSDNTFLNRIDGYVKLGFNIKGWKFGPFWRAHVAMDFKNTDAGIINRDQNSYQYGLETSGYFNIAKRVKLRFRAAYDFNTVYSRSPDPMMPDSFLDPTTRNPSNLQLDADLGVRIMQYVEIFSSANYFNHMTDFDDFMDSQIVRMNAGNNVKLGVRLNYK